MAKEYKTTPIPDRMVCERMAQKWKLVAEKNQFEIDSLIRRIKELEKSRFYWALLVGFLSALHILNIVIWFIKQ